MTSHRAVTSTNSADAPLVDVRDMVVVHTALLREFRLGPAAVRRVKAGDRKQARRVADHLQMIGDMLHHHHDGEDDLLWPLLMRRAPALARVLEDGVAQHARLDGVIADVARRRDTWANDPDTQARETLAAGLDELAMLLAEHLDMEERDVLPVAAAVLEPSEWAVIGERAAAAMPKATLALAFGMFAYEGDPVVITQMLSAAPPPVRVLLPRIAPRLYARRARRVHGTSRP